MKQMTFMVTVEVEEADAEDLQVSMYEFLSYGAEEASSIEGGIQHKIVSVDVAS